MKLNQIDTVDSHQNLIINYMQIHYNIYSGILLRKPLLGEILLSNYKRMLSKNLLKKIYTLY